MESNKKSIIVSVIALCIGYGCAVFIQSRNKTKMECEKKEYVFLGNKTKVYKGDEIDSSIYVDGVDPHGVYNKPNGVIPNDSLAVEMAKIVLFPIYGKDNIERQRPYQVTLINNELWSINGSLPKNALGGTFGIVINKSDGQVKLIFHEK